MSSFSHLQTDASTRLCVRHGTGLTASMLAQFPTSQLEFVYGALSEQKQQIREALDDSPARCDGFAFPYWFAVDALREEVLNPSGRRRAACRSARLQSDKPMHERGPCVDMLCVR